MLILKGQGLCSCMCKNLNIEFLCLPANIQPDWLQDLCGNPAAKDLNGKVKVSIKSPIGDGHKNLPLFEDKTSTIQLTLVDGKVHIPVSKEYRSTLAFKIFFFA